MKLSSGFLTERIKVYPPVMTESIYSGSGRITFPEERARRMKAAVTFQRGGRAFQAGAVLLQKLILVRCRPHKFLTERCQLDWQGERYKIVEFVEVKHEEYVSIKAEKITNENSQE